jgi:hypothetical protein
MRICNLPVMCKYCKGITHEKDEPIYHNPGGWNFYWALPDGQLHFGTISISLVISFLVYLISE